MVLKSRLKRLEDRILPGQMFIFCRPECQSVPRCVHFDQVPPDFKGQLIRIIDRIPIRESDANLLAGAEVRQDLQAQPVPTSSQYDPAPPTPKHPLYDDREQAPLRSGSVTERYQPDRPILNTTHMAA